MSQQCNVIFSFLHHAGQQVTLYEVCPSGHYDLVSPRDNVSQVLSNSWSMGRYNGASLYLKQLNLISGLQFRPMPRCPGKVPPPSNPFTFLIQKWPSQCLPPGIIWGWGGQETQTPPVIPSPSSTKHTPIMMELSGYFQTFPT